MELKDAIDEFITHCEYERGLGTKTLKAYRTDLNQFLRVIQINLKLVTVHDIDRDAIRNYLKTISDDYKPRSIRAKNCITQNVSWIPGIRRQNNC